LADLYGPFNVLVPVTVLAGACVFLLLAVYVFLALNTLDEFRFIHIYRKNAASLVAISVFYGFFSGACM
jgi:hypothetical protein